MSIALGRLPNKIPKCLFCWFSSDIEGDLCEPFKIWCCLYFIKQCCRGCIVAVAVAVGVNVSASIVVDCTVNFSWNFAYFWHSVWKVKIFEIFSIFYAILCIISLIFMCAPAGWLIACRIKWLVFKIFSDFMQIFSSYYKLFDILLIFILFDFYLFFFHFTPFFLHLLLYNISKIARILWHAHRKQSEAFAIKFELSLHLCWKNYVWVFFSF